MAALLSIGTTSALAATPAVPTAAVPAVPTRLTRLLAEAPATGAVRGIAPFDAVPPAADAAALAHLGLAVQPMHHLPLALVQGPVAALQRAVATGAADDVYPDERIHLL